MSPFVLGSVLVGVLGAVVLAVMIALRRVVPTNMVHIVQSSRNTTSYGKGRETGNTYYAWPAWIPKLGVVVTEFPESIFDVPLSGYEAYDQGRLPFVVDVRAFFRISKAETAAQRVSNFEELHHQLTAVLQGSVRRILSTNHLENIMQDRSVLGKQFTDEVDAQLEEWGVATVKSIEFMDIRDANQSVVIHNMMAKEQSRIEKESRMTVAENKRVAETAEIDAKRAIEVQKQDAQQQIGLRTAEAQKHVGLANEKAKQEVQAEAKVTAERNMDIEKVQKVRAAEIAKNVSVVNAEALKQVQITNADAQKAVQITNAEANKQVQITNADGQKDATIKIADGHLQQKLKEAEGIAAEGKAKASAEEAMQMAPVTAQVKLATEIGSNEGYQNYLITIRKLEAEQAVGIAMAQSVGNADLKIIANSGNVQSGIGSIGEVLSANGGTKIGAMVSALANNPDVVNVVNKVLKKDE